jgi:hypothetical protein
MLLPYSYHFFPFSEVPYKKSHDDKLKERVSHLLPLTIFLPIAPQSLWAWRSLLLAAP